jgi:hypothetical protein
MITSRSDLEKWRQHSDLRSQTECSNSNLIDSKRFCSGPRRLGQIGAIVCARQEDVPTETDDLIIERGASRFSRSTPASRDPCFIRAHLRKKHPMQWRHDRKVDELSRTEHRPRGKESLWKDDLEFIFYLLSRFALEESCGRPYGPVRSMGWSDNLHIS